jgi:hypothetical protein
MRTSPSIKRIAETIDCTKDEAAFIKGLWKAGKSLQYIEAVLSNARHGVHGVERLGTYKRTGEAVHYINTGDPYNGTLIRIGDRLIAECWGDLVERGVIREE